MKPRPTQFGARKNTASARQHASRLAVERRSNTICIEKENSETQLPSPQNSRPATGFENPLHAASQRAATGGEKKNERIFLTVREVAELLEVPVSWVYGRMRKRSTEQLPAYRVGKYWRFREEKILAWVKCHKRGSHVA
jgi:excisionase family DNA binding protein